MFQSAAEATNTGTPPLASANAKPRSVDILMCSIRSPASASFTTVLKKAFTSTWPRASATAPLSARTTKPWSSTRKPASLSARLNSASIRNSTGTSTNACACAYSRYAMKTTPGTFRPASVTATSTVIHVVLASSGTSRVASASHAPPTSLRCLAVKVNSGTPNVVHANVCLKFAKCP